MIKRQPAACFIAAILIVAGCGRKASRSVPAGAADISQPVVQYWDGGIHMIGRPPAVLFAAWADGMVVKRADEKTMTGFVSPREISKLLFAVRDAGFFTPSDSSLLDTYGMVFVDGPVRCLSVDEGEHSRTLFYHERDDLNRMDQRGPNADPSREQCEQFIAMWKRVVAEIERVTPDALTPFSGDRNLTCPQYTEKSRYSAQDNLRK